MTGGGDGAAMEALSLLGAKQRLLCCLFLFLFSSSAAIVAQAKTVRHEWDISYQFTYPNCVHKLAVTINGRTPGPTIRAVQGDTVVVAIKNSLMTENVAIHWHGIRQIGTPWADGTEGVTQCPILPGDTFEYRFMVDRPGTYMYHAQDGMQSSAGLNGMIVVAVAPGREPEPFVYDSEHDVLLNDWCHKSTYEQAAGLASVPILWVGEPQALLINGRGRFVNCSAMASSYNATHPECSTPVFAVVPGKTYRFRIASVTSLSALNFEIEEVMSGVNQGGEGSSAYDIALIQAQLRNLAQEFRDLTLSRHVTILSGKSDSGGNLSSYILPAAAVGAICYCYMWFKGWSFSDVMFVTKRNMASAVESMSKQLEQISSALAATKRHLTQRLENLDGKMDEQVEVSKTIRNEVNYVKTYLSQIGLDFEAIQQMAAGLEEKIELLDNKQDAANAGIWYLCRMAGGIKDGTNAKFFQEADEKLKLLDLAQTEQKSVKGLELFLESNKELQAIDSKPNTIAQNDAKKPMKTFDVPVKTAAVHRSNRFLFRKEGFAL